MEGVGKFCNYRYLSQKLYEIGLWNTYRKSQVADRSVSVPVSWVTLKGGPWGVKIILQFSIITPEWPNLAWWHSWGEAYFERNLADNTWVACFVSATPPSQRGGAKRPRTEILRHPYLRPNGLTQNDEIWYDNTCTEVAYI